VRKSIRVVDNEDAHALVPARREGPINPATYSWWTAYIFAVLETDASKRRARVIEALNAISKRLQEPIDASEHQAIKDAQSELRS
jgi:hypothetical protein